MKKLRWLYLNNNNFSSNIPNEIGNLSRLAYLWLNDNMFSGPLDPELFATKGFKYLQELLLHNNQITGTIPNEIGMMPRIRFISLHNTKLVGTIPSSLGMLTELEVLKLHETDLTGSVPDEICHLVQRGTLQTITIDCDKVSCDCGCSCTVGDDESDLPQVTHTLAPSAAAIDAAAAASAALPPTSAPIVTGAPTRAPVTSVPVVNAVADTRSPSAKPTVVDATPVPTEAPITSAPVTYAPTSAPPTSTPPTTSTPVVESEAAPDAVTAAEEASPEISPGAVTGAADFMLQLPDFTKEALLDPESPQSLALYWFQADPGLPQYSFERKLQRFGKTYTGCPCEYLVQSTLHLLVLPFLPIVCSLLAHSNGNTLLLHKWI